ncbi:hypothetical protein Tco_0390222 [Tanacetum coccineum]
MIGVTGAAMVRGTAIYAGGGVKNSERIASKESDASRIARELVVLDENGEESEGCCLYYVRLLGLQSLMDRYLMMSTRVGGSGSASGGNETSDSYELRHHGVELLKECGFMFEHCELKSFDL